MTPDEQRALMPSLKRLFAIIDRETPVNQQRLIEVLLARHAAKMGKVEHERVVIDGVAKHAHQLLDHK